MTEAAQETQRTVRFGRRPSGVSFWDSPPRERPVSPSR